MALDPSIALGVRPIELPNQLAQYGQLAAIQNAQNQNALAQYQLSSAQRTDEQQNSLYAAAKQPGFNLDYQTAVQYGPAGIAAYKAKQEADNALTEGQIKRTKLLTDKLALLPEAYKTADTPEAYLKLHETVHSDPVLGPWLKSTGATPEKGRATIQAAVESGKFNDLRLASMQSVAQLLESVKPQVVAASSSVFDPKTKFFTQAPAAQERTDTDLIRNYNAAVKQGFVGTIFDYERKIKEASRAPGQPRAEPAPTVTSIQDPTNPNQMISINARDYRGGGVGSPGVIGLTGKTPAATAKQDAIDKGHAQLASVVDDLRASYDTLEKAAAIPSTKRGTISNLMSSTQASGIGQFLGRMGGTEEQSARDTINSSRMMLLNSIKQATGMSAQQLNSNVELTSWLKAVSDPTQSTETVNKILGNIEKFVESGGKYSAKKDSAAAAPPAANAVTNPEFPGFSVKKP